MSSTEDWNEDDWFASYEHQRAMWESVSDEYDKTGRIQRIVS